MESRKKVRQLELDVYGVAVVATGNPAERDDTGEAKVLTMKY